MLEIALSIPSTRRERYGESLQLERFISPITPAAGPWGSLGKAQGGQAAARPKVGAGRPDKPEKPKALSKVEQMKLENSRQAGEKKQAAEVDAVSDFGTSFSFEF